MDFLTNNFSTLFGITIVLLGLYAFVKGEVSVGAEGTDKYDRKLSGGAAKVVAVAFIVTGVTMCFSSAFGIGLFVAVLAFAWLMGESTA